MKRWLITPERGNNFTVDADTAEAAIELVEEEYCVDIIYINEVPLFDVLSNNISYDNGLEAAE